MATPGWGDAGQDLPPKPAPTTPPPPPVAGIPSQYMKDYAKLAGPQRDAAAALISMFSQYNLESLAGSIIGFIKQGFGSDTITIMLQETPQYKARFAANEARKKAGLSVLSPREYLETERSYRSVLATSGMPKGFYDQQADFQKFLENDLSPQELNDRVKAWQTEAMRDKAGLDAIRKITGFGVSDYAAYLMDPQRALPVLQRTAKAVSFAAAAQRHGYDVSRDLANQYGAFGVNPEDAEKGFAAIQEVQGETDKLAKIYGLDGYTVEEAASEVFGGDAKAGEKRKKLASQERATFSGSSKGKTGKATGSNAY